MSDFDIHERWRWKGKDVDKMSEDELRKALIGMMRRETRYHHERLSFWDYSAQMRNKSYGAK